MDHTAMFAVLVIAMAAAHLTVRTWRKISRHLSADRPKASKTAPGKHVDWYCFFRPRVLNGIKPTAPGARQTKTARPRPRAMAVR